MKTSTRLLVRHSKDDPRYLKSIPLAVTRIVLTSIIPIIVVILVLENGSQQSTHVNGDPKKTVKSYSLDAIARITRISGVRDLNEDEDDGGGVDGSKISECRVGCNSNADCKKGLFCAKANIELLSILGYSTTKAYCNGFRRGTPGYVCYKPSKLKPLLRECQIDCNTDDDCADGLLCAQVHNNDLKDIPGMDKLKAYCVNIGTKTAAVCYDPAVALGCKTTQFALNNACCMLLDFDDIELEEDSLGFTYTKLINVYKGFSFPNVYVQQIPTSDLLFGYNTGYRYGTISSPNHAFNEYGRPFTINAIDRPFLDTNLFSLDSLYVTAGFTSNIRIQIQGFGPTGRLIATTTAQLSNFKTPSLITVDKNQFKGLSSIQISSISTTPANVPKPKNGEPLHFVVDDIIVCS